MSTRFLSYFHGLKKTYVALLELGVGTDSLDCEGQITQTVSVPDMSKIDLRKIETQFTGEITQTPPVFSNVKLDGVRARKRARAGENVSLPSRKVSVSALSIAGVSSNQLRIHCTVSAGTYIRTLAADIAHALGTVGHLTALRRLQIGDFSVGKTPTVKNTLLSMLTDVEALPFLPLISLELDDAKKFANGRRFSIQNYKDGLYRVMCAEVFLGIGKIKALQIATEQVIPFVQEQLTKR